MDLGYKVTSVYDIDSSKMKDVPSSVIKGSCPRDITEQSDIIITSLPKPLHVKAAYEGEDGILQGIREGQIWIDHSTTDYHQTLEFAKQIEERGAKLLECPITGGLLALKQKEMTTLVGGSKELCEFLTPLFKASYSTILYVSPMGSATIAKVASNMLCAVGIIASGEVLMLTKKAGLDPSKVFDAIRVSSGNMFVWETGVPVVFNGTYDKTFDIDLHCKDIRLGLSFASENGVPMVMNELAGNLYEKAKDKYGGDAACYTPVRLLEDDMNQSLQEPGYDNWEYNLEVHDGSFVVKHKNI